MDVSGKSTRAHIHKYIKHKTSTNTGARDAPLVVLALGYEYHLKVLQYKQRAHHYADHQQAEAQTEA